MEWKLADAKNRLNELLTKATTEGPQTIRRPNDSVVVIAEAEYRALTGEKLTLGQFLAQGPKVDLKLKRKKSRMRDAGL
jgi:prevent-host-death family protein